MGSPTRSSLTDTHTDYSPGQVPTHQHRRMIGGSRARIAEDGSGEPGAAVRDATNRYALAAEAGFLASIRTTGVVSGALLTSRTTLVIATGVDASTQHIRRSTMDARNVMNQVSRRSDTRSGVRSATNQDKLVDLTRCAVRVVPIWPNTPNSTD